MDITGLFPYLDPSFHILNSAGKKAYDYYLQMLFSGDRAMWRYNLKLWSFEKKIHIIIKIPDSKD